MVLVLAGGMRVSARAATESVHPLFDLSSPDTSPFPSDRFTVVDDEQLTGRRVALPVPSDCTATPDECEDLAVLNTLDGFSAQPLLSIPFDGDIDPATVTNTTVFLIRLGHNRNTEVVGTNRTVWDPASRTLHTWSDEQLDQHTPYALIVTRGVRDSGGNPVAPDPAFDRFRHDLAGRHGDHHYRLALLRAIQAARRVGVRETDLAVVSMFTTQSVTASLERIAEQIHAATPAPVDFGLGPDGAPTVFAFADVQGIVHNRQVGVSPPAFSPVPIDLAPTRFVPGAVGRIAFGRFSTPTYLVQPGAYIPPVPTGTGVPLVQGFETIYLTLIVPAGSPPAGGWPVTVFGHGASGNKDGPGGAFQFASVLASRGLATVAITQAGRGFGPGSTLTVQTIDGAANTFLSGGRGIDQNGDNEIAFREGDEATAPRRLIINRDSLQQHVADLLRLVRVIQVGIDIDGDGQTDLDPGHISYLGQSLGGMYGLDLFALEPAIHAAVLNVPAGPLAEGRRLSPGFRPGTGALFAARLPSLLNSPGITAIDGVPVGEPSFNENLPLRNQPPVTNDITGAMALQQWFDRAAWAAQASNPVAWAPHLRRDPLPGVPLRPVLFQFALGDQGSANPGNRNIIAAGELADRSTLYRHDRYFAEHPTAAKNPHGFLGQITNPVMSPIARGALEQTAAFLASGGVDVIDPDILIGTEPNDYFETPITSDSLAQLDAFNFIP